MSVNIEMPKLSDTMTEGTVIKWHKNVGDSVEIGDIIADIETDKATMEMEAFDEGVLTEIRIPAGQKAPIGGVLAVLDGGTGAAPPAPVATAVPVSQPEPAASNTQSPSPTVIATQVPEPRRLTGDRILVSPLARRVAFDLGVNLATVIGTGPAGRITHSDVEAAATAAVRRAAQGPSTEASAAAALTASIKAKVTAIPAPAAPAASVTPAAAPVVSVTPPAAPIAPAAPAKPAPAPIKPPAPAAPAPQAILPIAKPEDQTLDLSTMRKVIASRLLLSKTTIPHFYLHIEVDAGPLMALRKQINDQAEKTHGNRYSVNDFILKAVVNAADLVPEVNASFAGDHIVRFKHVGLSIAISVDDGLVTPVIKEAQTRSLLSISRSVKDFAVRAKEKKLRPDEFDGGTITVSNLGAWGIESFDAIVNPPQATILSVGAAIEKPVVKNGMVVPGLRMNLGLSCDHRVVDGAIGAKFLSELRKLIEQPTFMLL